MSHEHPDYNGSSWNLEIVWDDGTISWEPLDVITKSDPVSCAAYAQANNLLNTKGWKRFRRACRNANKMIRILKILSNKAKKTHGPQYKYGVRLPDRSKGPFELEAENGNTLWHDADRLELRLLNDYTVFEDLGLHTPELEASLWSQAINVLR